MLAGCLATIVYAFAYILINRSHGAMGLGALRNIFSGILIGQGRQIWLYSVIDLLSAGLLWLSLNESRWSKLMRNRHLQAIGRVSYGGYIYHALCIHWVVGFLRPHLNFGSTMVGKLEFGLVIFAFALPLTIALATLSYRRMEQPIIAVTGRRLRRHLAR
jgi:peptidoglycan/LPS O-acetylase OafA/YrhL